MAKSDCIVAGHTPDGRRIAICPATYSDATCKSCGACARVRHAVIGFPAHSAWRQVEAAMAARDVPAGESWAFPEHRTMAEVLADETTTARRFNPLICGLGGFASLRGDQKAHRSAD